MEVHHHPELHHHKKKFGEYFLEFVMIFLAVTLGFFAESLRENINDNEKEKEYIKSLIQNLEDDTAKVGIVSNANLEKFQKLNALISLSFKNISDPVNRKLLYSYCRGASVGFYSIFKSNDATMLQLVNSGGLRLIRKDHVADSIAKYDNEIKLIYTAETLYINATDAATTFAHEVLDYTIYHDTSYFKNDEFTDKPLPVLLGDPQKLKLFFNKVDIEIGATKNYINNLKRRLPFTTQLIAFLKKEYDLQ